MSESTAFLIDSESLLFKAEPLTCVTRTPGYKYCNGYQDFENMELFGVALYRQDFGFKFLQIEDIADIRKIFAESFRQIGFNSLYFDDYLLRKYEIEADTNYDLLDEIRVATGQPRGYVKGLTRRGYSLAKLAETNLETSRLVDSASAPKLLQSGFIKPVIASALHDLEIIARLYANRFDLIDPVSLISFGCIDYNLRPGESFEIPF